MIKIPLSVSEGCLAPFGNMLVLIIKISMAIFSSFSFSSSCPLPSQKDVVLVINVNRLQG